MIDDGRGKTMKAVLLALTLPVAMHAQLVDRESEKERELRQIADSKVIAALVAHGSDVTKPHYLEHHFIAPSEKIAKGIADLGRKRGYHPIHPGERTEKDGRKVWFLDLARAIVPTKDAVFAESRTMTMIAHHFGAKYDGWGCEVEK